RELLTVPRRDSHYVIRSLYLGFFFVIGLTAWQAIIGWHQSGTIGDNARFGRILFQIFSIVELSLLLIFSALAATTAITKEKDRRTFILLLLTDLRSYEIVLGKLLGSLLQIILLLLLGVLPVLSVLMMLGGVSPLQVGQTALVMACTCLASGS